MLKNFQNRIFLQDNKRNSYLLYIIFMNYEKNIIDRQYFAGFFMFIFMASFIHKTGKSPRALG